MENRFHSLLARKLSGDITAPEREELDQLLAADPSLQLTMEWFEQMMVQETQKLPSSEAREAYIHHWLKYQEEISRPQISPAPKHHFKGSLSRISMPLWTLVAMLLIGLGWWVWKPAPITGIAKSTEWTTYTTSAREKQKLELPDGSTVWLNAGSTLRLDQQGMKEGARQVYLEGEAFFDIAHDTSRPFKVRSGSMEIRVLGTAFNVRAYPNDADFETSLIRGAVEVRLDNRPEDVYQLRPHEKLVVSRQTDLPSKAPINMGQSAPASLVSLKKLPVADSGHFVEEIAWLENKVAFQSESFASISGKLERKYGYHFVFENIDASNLQFTGSFTTETIEQALAAMQLVHPFQYRIEKDCIYIR